MMDALGYGQASPCDEFRCQGPRDVRGPIAPGHRVGKLHDVVKESLLLAASDLKDVHEAILGPRQGFEALDSGELPLKRSGV